MKTDCRCRWGIAVVALWFAVATARAESPWWGNALDAPLQQAGTNRAALVTALAKAPVAQREGMQFLIANMPERDLVSLSAEFLLENVALAYESLAQAPWAKQVAHELFLNEILPYANVTEDRDNWRARLREIALPLIADCTTPGEAAHRINQKLFKQLKVKYSTKRRASDQGPFETMQTGIATCTGLSILLVDACRSVGIPARVVGTPMWVNNSGNHTWVEVWDGDWHFAGAAEASPQGLDHGWFVGNAAQAIANERQHAIYAVSFRKTGVTFPLEWKRGADYVPAVNVTTRYAKQSAAPAVVAMKLEVKVLNRPVGERVAAIISITDSADAKLHWEGISKTDPADVNDHVSFSLPQQRTYIVEAEQGGVKNKRYYSPGTNTQDVLVIHMSGVPVVMSPEPMICALPPKTMDLKAGEVAALKTAVTEFFAASGEKQAGWKFSGSLNGLLTKNEPAVRRAVWEAYLAAPIHRALKQSFDENKARSEDKVSPYTVKAVGTRPAQGWALFIAMHGGGGAPQELNDSQWLKMQSYYRDHPEVGGYKYVALRAPNNEWNGFYTGYVYPLIANLVNQFLLFGDVDPNKVFIMGYSHGGYGAFAIGPKMPDRFAAIHSSAAAPADGVQPQTLRNTPFTYMVGEKDTDHGRIKRAQEFAAAIEKLRGERKDIFPVHVSVIANHPHSGLPDREKIAEMYPAVRNPVPRELTWALTDPVIRDFFWLHVDAPQRGQEFQVTCSGNRITVSAKNFSRGTVLVDSRLIDFQQPVILESAGKTTKHKLKPDLRTLCETMQRRGDPELAFTASVPISTITKVAKKP